MNVCINFPYHIFRAYDIRGKLTQLTPRLVESIAYAMLKQFQHEKQKTISIGYDARLTSPYFAHIFKTVFIQSGFEVIDVGCCSTPLLYFTARHKTQGNGVMITASHNPKTDNGIKWLVKNEPPTPEHIQSIAQDAVAVYLSPTEYVKPEPAALSTDSTEQLYQDSYDASLDFLHINQLEYCQAYRQYLLSDIQLSRPFKVVVDGLNGSAGYCAHTVLKQLNCDVIALRCEPNGHFPEHAPDPSQAQHLEKLTKAVLQHQADLGIALDGDGDRVVIVNEKGEILTADQLIFLFSAICLQDHPHGEIVYDVKCSNIIEKLVQQLGGTATMIRTGSSFLRRYLQHNTPHAIFGGEYAGHYVFNDGRGLGYDDGLYAALRIMAYWSLQENNQQTLSALMSRFPKRYGTEDVYIATYGMSPQSIFEKIEKKLHAIHATQSIKITKIDGLRLDFCYGFGIIRASNTGDYFTVRFEGQSFADLLHIKNDFINLLQDICPQIAEDIAHLY